MGYKVKISGGWFDAWILDLVGAIFTDNLSKKIN
jgi:hypothetical protein